MCAALYHQGEPEAASNVGVREGGGGCEPVCLCPCVRVCAGVSYCICVGVSVSMCACEGVCRRVLLYTCRCEGVCERVCACEGVSTRVRACAGVYMYECKGVFVSYCICVNEG